MKKCPKCNTLNEDDDLFCSECGSSIDDIEILSEEDSFADNEEKAAKEEAVEEDKANACDIEYDNDLQYIVPGINELLMRHVQTSKNTPGIVSTDMTVQVLGNTYVVKIISDSNRNLRYHLTFKQSDVSAYEKFKGMSYFHTFVIDQNLGTEIQGHFEFDNMSEYAIRLLNSLICGVFDYREYNPISGRKVSYTLNGEKHYYIAEKGEHKESNACMTNIIGVIIIISLFLLLKLF